MYRKICLPALAILGLTSFELLAAKHTWSGAVSGLWSNDANWAGGAPQNGETDVVLVFPIGGLNKTMTNDVSVQNINLFEFRTNGYLLSGNALPMSGSIVMTERGSVRLDVPINLLSPLDVFMSQGSTVTFGGTVSGAFGITTSGGSQSGLVLEGANLYTGITTVLSGGLEVAHDQGLGAGSGLPETGTIVKPGARISLFGAAVANESLSIGSHPDASLAAYCPLAPCIWGGPITLTGDTTMEIVSGNPFVIDGAISGPFRLLARSAVAGTLIVLGGSNAFGGPTSLVGFGNIDVLGSTPSVFNLGSVSDYSNRLGVAPGAVIGRFELGPGSAELGVAGAAAGSAAITNGLLLNTAKGKLSIRVQSAVLADRFAVGGTANVSGATLAVDSSAFDPAAGTSYVIVANDGVDAILGTFAGLPEGWIFTANARNYRISYVGGDGNDLTLTRVVGTPVELQTFSAE